MKTIEIHEISTSQKYGKFGVLLIGGLPFCVTLERPFLNNERNISSIPKGVYACERFTSESHPKTWEVKDVHGRSAILFHSGNVITDTQGCILLGERFGELDGKPAILGSRDAMKNFMSATDEYKGITLVIT